jgi:GTPase involved in cell partitioning and DNA repair
MADYKTVRGELDTYGKGMTDKEEIIVLTKTDCSDEKTIASTVKKFEKLKKEVVTVSVLEDAAVKALSEFFVRKVKGE